MKRNLIGLLTFFTLSVSAPVALWAQQASQGTTANGFFAGMGVLNFLLIFIGIELGIILIILIVKDPKDLSFGKFFSNGGTTETTEEEMGHAYDGIREIDNPVPAWLKAIFYSTIIWGFSYLVYYHVTGVGATQLEEYAAEMKEYEKDKVVAALNPATLKVITDPNGLVKAKKIFKNVCSACHGENGQGLSGPNLTDPYWIHGGTISEIYMTITNGVSGKSMAPYRTQVSDEDRHALASYVISLQGSKPKGGLPPDGILFEGDPNSLPGKTASDSTATDSIPK